jgi:hypothetical protein
MHNNKRDCALTSWVRNCSFALMVIGSPISQAATVWTGPNINFTQSANTRSDTILAGKVVLTRGANRVLFNTAAGETSAGSTSPADTVWAFGTIDNFSTLTYQTLDSLRNGNLAGLILNQPMVMHLTNEDIYLSVEFTSWGQHFAGGFSYTRSTPAVAVQPTVSITSPSAGAVFGAPASVKLTSSATFNGGAVTNVEYFAGATSLGQATAAPFGVTGSIPAPGAYALTAVATAAGISATSSVVNITVAAPVAVSLSPPALSNGLFSFSYRANLGLMYVVQSSSNLLDWVTVVTNVVSSNPSPFSEAFSINAPRYYRVGRVTSP